MKNGECQNEARVKVREQPIGHFKGETGKLREMKYIFFSWGGAGVYVTSLGEQTSNVGGKKRD